ncbi:MAG: polysaccharide deacetylase family protein [Bacillota bacterium]
MVNKFRFYFIPLHRLVLLGLLLLIMTASLFVNLMSAEVTPVVNDQLAPYYHGPEDKERIALTINVAWGEEYLPDMLATLEDKDVQATFFFLGRWVKKFPELTKQIAKRGHEVGNHGYYHDHPNQLSTAGLTKMIKQNEELLVETTGYQPDLFAPPYGEYNEQVVEVAADLGYKTILWTADTIDWQRPAPEVIIKRVVTKASNGGIVLMHPTEPTAQALGEMIDRLESEGYQLVTVSELLAE